MKTKKKENTATRRFFNREYPMVVFIPNNSVVTMLSLPLQQQIVVCSRTLVSVDAHLKGTLDSRIVERFAFEC